MYEAHFSLTHRPFRTTPDTSSYYPATGHEQILNQLVRAVKTEEGLVLLAGEPGTGKTLLCHALLERLGPEFTSALVTNSHLPDRASLLQAILFDYSQPYRGMSEQELRLSLTEFFLHNFSAGRRALVVVDEAHYLEPDLLEELRLLGNLETGKGKAVQIVLAAQPGILDLVRLPELTTFRQRLVVRVQLEPFGIHEASDYLVHHLRLAGVRPGKIFTDEAFEVLAKGSQGNPRLLNQAAHQALTLAYEVDTRIVDAEVALEALAYLGLDIPEPDEEMTAFTPGVLPEDEAPENANGLLLGGDDDPPYLPRSNFFGPDRRPA